MFLQNIIIVTEQNPIFSEHTVASLPNNHGGKNQNTNTN